MPTTRYCPRCLTTFQDEPEGCPNLGCRAAAPFEGWPSLLSVGDTLDRTYRILEVLAGGAAGMTYRARETDPEGALVGPELAIKVLYAQRDSGPFLRRLATEAQILQDLAHPHIVECLGFVHRAGRAPYLVTRFEAGGTLHHHVGRVGPLPPWAAAVAVTDIVDALAVAHQAGIVHRDLKPGNVLLAAEVDAEVPPDVKVADFGIAKVQGGVGGGTRVGSFLGTPEYAAPEQLLGLEPGGSADLFAAGGVLWYLLTGDLPVRLSQRHDPHHCHDEVLAQLPRTLPKSVRELPGGTTVQEALHGLMAIDPRNRWSAGEAIEALREAGGKRSTGPAPRRRTEAAIGSGGTIFVQSDATFLWSPDGDEDEDAATPSTPPPHPASPGRPSPPLPASAAPAPRPRLHDADRAAPSPRSSLDDLFAPHIALELPESAAPPVQDADAEWVDAPADSPPPAERSLALPMDPGAAIQVLGDADPADVERFRLAALRLDDRQATDALRRAFRDGDPDVRRGAARLVELTARVDQASNLRNLSRDPVAAVRVATATALGAVASGSVLPHLAKMTEDADPSVRAAAVLALARAWRRDGDLKRGREQVSRSAQDPDSRVRAASATGLEILR